MKRFSLDSSIVKISPLKILEIETKYEKLKGDKKEVLKELFLSSQTEINSETIAQVLGMSTQKFDFFLSYSHENIDEASAIVEVLSARGFSVFADYLYWGSVDDFLDDWWKSEKDTEGGLSEDRINKRHSTAYVLLETMLTRTLANSKAFLFVEPNSVWTRLSHDTKTFSPWIYHELFMASLINSSEISHEFKERFCEGVQTDVSFNLDLSHYYAINIMKWQQILSLPERKESRIKVLSILDSDDFEM